MSTSAKRNSIIGGVLLASGVAAFSVMLYQVIEKGSELENQITTLREERAQEKTYLELKRDAEDSVQERAQLHEYFLERESDSIEFLNLIETSAPQAGVSLPENAFALQSVTDPTDESEWIEVAFSFTGTRIEVERFIRVLENVPYVSRLTSVQIASQSSAEWQADVTIQVRTLAYDQ